MSEKNTINRTLCYDAHDLKFEIENHIYLLGIMPEKSRKKNGDIIKRNDGTTKKEVVAIKKISFLDFDLNDYTRLMQFKSKLSAFFKKIEIENAEIKYFLGALVFNKIQRKTNHGKEYALKIEHKTTKKCTEKILSGVDVEDLQIAINDALRYMKPQFLPNATQIYSEQ